MLASTLSRLPLPLALVDADTDPIRILFVSDALAELSNCTADELKNADVRILDRDRNSVRLPDTVRQAVQRNRRVMTSIRPAGRRAGDSAAHLEVEALPNGNAGEAILIFRSPVGDGTSEAPPPPDEDSDLNAMAVLSEMSHELRTPLNAISGFGEIMESEMFGPHGNDKYREYSGDIASTARHLVALLSDILDFSRADAGKLPFNEEPVTLEATISEVAALLGVRAREKGVQLEVVFAPDVPRLLADPLRLRQILINLVSNAIKFTEHAGDVVISTSTANDGGVTLSVMDTGLGIAPGKIGLAASPFGRVEEAGRPDPGGTGLGLPLTRRLVEMHGGHLEIMSTTGQGTIVSAHFPPRRSLPREATEAAVPGKKVPFEDQPAEGH